MTDLLPPFTSTAPLYIPPQHFPRGNSEPDELGNVTMAKKYGGHNAPKKCEVFKEKKKGKKKKNIKIGTKV